MDEDADGERSVVCRGGGRDFRRARGGDELGSPDRCVDDEAEGGWVLCWIRCDEDELRCRLVRWSK